MNNPPDRSMAQRHVRTTTLGMDVKAEISQLLMLRAVAETAAMVAGFSMDEVTDLRVALDEIATCLMQHAVPDTLIRCEFAADKQGMRVQVSSVSTVPDPIDETGLGWQVLKVTTDHISIDSAPYDPTLDGRPVTVTLERARGHR
ncbi:ATP-binding protein [Nocardia lasii]|uniref:ATP-binding protein n=1 Tax=Nocardia lasii TaxID=1616107 RepID=A0ABW1JLY5_9NOCA